MGLQFSANHKIRANRQNCPDNVCVLFLSEWFLSALNAQRFEPFATPLLSRIFVLGLEGDDQITVQANVTVATRLDGGDGADKLRGGGGVNLLLGGNDGDILIGGGQRNILIGGLGADRLTGARDQDLLIAGRTAFDSNDAALDLILREWITNAPYLTRINNIMAGNSAPALDDTTVFDDGVRNQLNGAAELDWFVIGGADVVRRPVRAERIDLL